MLHTKQPWVIVRLPPENPKGQLSEIFTQEYVIILYKVTIRQYRGVIMQISVYSTQTDKPHERANAEDKFIHYRSKPDSFVKFKWCFFNYCVTIDSFLVPKYSVFFIPARALDMVRVLCAHGSCHIDDATLECLMPPTMEERKHIVSYNPRSININYHLMTISIDPPSVVHQ